MIPAITVPVGRIINMPIYKNFEVCKIKSPPFYGREFFLSLNEKHPLSTEERQSNYLQVS